jgi:hypothetical protein
MADHTDRDDAQGTDSPPDRAAAGDVTTTGHSDHDVDVHDAHDAHGADAAHGGGHGGHGDDGASEQPTIVPTTWRQLIFPALILLFVAILLAGPVMNAFSSRPAAPAAAEEHASGTPAAGEAEATEVHTEVPASPTPPAPTSTPPEPTATVPEATPTTAAGGSDAPLIATQTAVAVAGERGEVARVPVSLEFAGATFAVQPGSGLLPDWKPSQAEDTATWIAGTVANHVLYIPYNAQNEALFKAARQGDTVKLAMNTGQVFSFTVTRSERATNGPSTQQGQFTVSTAMAQDHAGVTLFLTGDPAADRAVVQADFTGNIQ